MKRLYKPEDLEMFREHVVAVNIERDLEDDNSAVTVLAVSRIKDLEKDIPRYQLELFYENSLWNLDESIYHGAATIRDDIPWLIQAITEKKKEGRSKPGYFTQNLNCKETIYEKFVDMYGTGISQTEVQNMLAVTDEEFSDLVDVLLPGTYIFALLGSSQVLRDDLMG